MCLKAPSTKNGQTRCQNSEFSYLNLRYSEKTMIILMGYHMISYVSLHEQDEVSPGKPYKPAVQVYPPCLIPLCSGTPNSS